METMIYDYPELSFSIQELPQLTLTCNASCWVLTPSILSLEVQDNDFKPNVVNYLKEVFSHLKEGGSNE
jgi:hypothetical protein